MYEGGIRVPAVIEWPARIPEPRVSETIAVTTDILPTLCDLLDLPLPDRPIDGISLVPLLDGEMTERPEPIFFWYYTREQEKAGSGGPWLSEEEQRGITPTSKRHFIQFQNYRHPVAFSEGFLGRAAVMDNRYKLVIPQDKDSAVELYDISADPAETDNLAEELPEKVRAMESDLRDWQRGVEKSLTGADYKTALQ
jgi:arylsulfatase A-like enzyme